MTGRDAEHGDCTITIRATAPQTANNWLMAGLPNGETVYEDRVVLKGVYADGTTNATVISAQEYYKASLPQH